MSFHVLWLAFCIMLHSCLPNLYLTLRPDLSVHSCDRITLLNEINLIKGKATHNTSGPYPKRFELREERSLLVLERDFFQLKIWSCLVNLTENCVDLFECLSV